MKAIAYSIQNHEKVSLAKANSKRHDFLFISNDFNQENLEFAVGKDVLILFKLEALTTELLKQIKEIGIKLIISRDYRPQTNILQLATEVGIPIVQIQCSWSNEKKAQQVINILDYASTGSQQKSSLPRDNRNKKIDQ